MLRMRIFDIAICDVKERMRWTGTLQYIFTEDGVLLKKRKFAGTLCPVRNLINCRMMSVASLSFHPLAVCIDNPNTGIAFFWNSHYDIHVIPFAAYRISNPRESRLIVDV